jgi:hypothetical protein
VLSSSPQRVDALAATGSKDDGPSRRDRSDAELNEQIHAVHQESKGRSEPALASGGHRGLGRARGHPYKRNRFGDLAAAGLSSDHSQ